MLPGGRFRASKSAESRRGGIVKRRFPPDPLLLLGGRVSGCFVWRLWLQRIP